MGFMGMFICSGIKLVIIRPNRKYIAIKYLRYGLNGLKMC